MQPRAYSKFIGSVSLWRYTENERNYPGWHLSADTSGAASLRSLLADLEVSGGYRTVSITPPSEALLRVPNNRGGKAAWQAPGRWRIHYLSAPEESRSWRVGEDTDTKVLSAGKAWLAEFRAGIEGVEKGKGDYSIGVPSPWFWWWRA